MKKLILVAAVAIVTLASCGKSYVVLTLDNGRFVGLESSEIGNDKKVGDTIRMESTWRIDSVTVAKTQFTGVVTSVIR